MDTKGLSPPGEIININGRKVHFQRGGSGSPIVILESGWYDDSLMFNEIHPEIANITDVISYDRAGIGWSEISPNQERVSLEIANELLDLLKALHVDQPLVLVGWSMGGIYIREFAYQNPKMVAGMVLIDSSHENQDNRFPDDITGILNKNFNEFMELLTVRSQMTHQELLKALPLLPHWHRRHPSTHNYYEDRERPELYKQLFYSASFRDDLSQGDKTLKPLGDIPLIILSSNKFDVPNLNADQTATLYDIWSEMQADLVALSTDSRQIIVDSGHDIVTEKPQIVIDAIREVVLKVKGKNI